MTTLGLFAQQAAVAIAQSAAVRGLSALLRRELADLDGAGDLGARTAEFVARTEESAEYRDILRLAGQLRRLVRQGEAGRRLSLEIIDAVVNYLDAPGRATGSGAD